jgi:hypothetical protein
MARRTAILLIQKQIVMSPYNQPGEADSVQRGSLSLKTESADEDDARQGIVDQHLYQIRKEKYSGLTLVTGVMSVLGALILVAGLAIAMFGGVWISTGKITTEGVALFMGGIAYFAIGLLAIGAGQALRVLRDIAINTGRPTD